MFFNQGLPTSIGGDAIRVLDVAGRGFRKRDALYGVAIDRIAGLGALILLTLVAYVFNRALLPLAGVSTDVADYFTEPVGNSQSARVKTTFLARSLSATGLCKSYFSRLDLAFSHNRFMLLILSILVPSFAMLGFYATGWALGLRFDLMTYFAIVPPALVLTIIPASIAGWGVREGALVGLFSLIGADKTIVLMMSLLYGITLIIVSIPGLIVFLQGRQRVQTQRADS
jgi:uncharacterized membrane protein YbhN (UPF0104 family)